MAKKDKKKLPAGMTRRKDGIIVCRFTIEGKRYAVYGSTTDECRVKEAEKRQAIKEGRYKTGKELTVSEYADRWIEAKRDTVKETTLRSNRILLNRIIETPIDGSGTKFGDLKLTKVEPQNVRDLQAALRKELKTKDPKGKEKTRKGMTTRSANDSISLLKALFSSAIIERIVIWNPADGIKPLKRTEEAARDTIHRALTKQETATFLEFAEKEKSWYYNLYVFLLNTGTRIGEAGALTPRDITAQGVRISRTITRTEVGGYIIGDDTKTEAGRRYIPLNEDAKQAIEAQKKLNKLIRSAKVIEWDAPIFIAQYGSLLIAGNVNRDIENICEKAGIEKFSVHAFRDTFATRCVEADMPAKVLQTIMGHTDIKMTMNLYAHCEDKTKEEHLKVVNFK